jgi:hypothetical protein
MKIDKGPGSLGSVYDFIFNILLSFSTFGSGIADYPLHALKTILCNDV